KLRTGTSLKRSDVGAVTAGSIWRNRIVNRPRKTRSPLVRCQSASQTGTAAFVDDRTATTRHQLFRLEVACWDAKSIKPGVERRINGSGLIRRFSKTTARAFVANEVKS